MAQYRKDRGYSGRFVVENGRYLIDNVPVSQDTFKRQYPNAAHKIPLEMGASVLNHMSGPKVGERYLETVRELLNSDDNLRVKTKYGNQDVDRKSEKLIIKILNGEDAEITNFRNFERKLEQIKSSFEIIKDNPKSKVVPGFINKIERAIPILEQAFVEQKAAKALSSPIRQGTGSSDSSFTGSPCYKVSDSPSGPRTKAGLPDMRYAANRSPSSPVRQDTAVSNSSSIFTGSPCYRVSDSPSGPCTKSGNPDMRYSANRSPSSPTLQGYSALTGDAIFSSYDSIFSSFTGSAYYSLSPFASGPLTKGGLPDMRYSANRR